MVNDAPWFAHVPACTDTPVPGTANQQDACRVPKSTSDGESPAPRAPPAGRLILSRLSRMRINNLTEEI
jgi:hypothetical protein